MVKSMEFTLFITKKEKFFKRMYLDNLVIILDFLVFSP